MDFIAFMTIIILAVSIFSLVFGVIAYFLYKAREKSRKSDDVSYEDILDERQQEYIFFEK